PRENRTQNAARGKTESQRQTEADRRSERRALSQRGFAGKGGQLSEFLSTGQKLCRDAAHPFRSVRLPFQRSNLYACMTKKALRKIYLEKRRTLPEETFRKL